MVQPGVDGDAILLRLLGPLDVNVNGALQSVPGVRRRAVLAALAIRPGVVVSSDHLIDIVWENDPPVTALNTLQSHVSYLRREFLLHRAIVARAPGYVMYLNGSCTDVQVAESLISQAEREPNPHITASLLRRALALWRGYSLADISDLTHFGEAATRLERLRGLAVRRLTEVRLILGEHKPLAAELESLAGCSPSDEDLFRQLMLALYRSGRQGEALAAFHRLREHLDRELGIVPSMRLRELHIAILRQDPALDLPLAGRVESATSLAEAHVQHVATAEKGGHSPDEGSGLESSEAWQLQQMPLRVRKVAQALAVLAQRSVHDEIALVAELPPAEVSHSLAILCDSGLVTPTGEYNVFFFSHRMTCASIYNSISALDKATMHLRAARAAANRDDAMGATSHLIRVPPGFTQLDISAALAQVADTGLARAPSSGEMLPQWDGEGPNDHNPQT